MLDSSASAYPSFEHSITNHIPQQTYKYRIKDAQLVRWDLLKDVIRFYGFTGGRQIVHNSYRKLSDRLKILVRQIFLYPWFN